MKLWLLQPRRDIPPVNPWEPSYDRVFTVVVRAESEQQARSLATSASDYEDGHNIMGDAWVNREWSTCVELTADGPAEVIITDIRNG